MMDEAAEAAAHERAKAFLREALRGYRELFEDQAMVALRADLEALLVAEQTPRVTATSAPKTKETKSRRRPAVCDRFPEIVGQSSALLKVFDLILKVASTDTTVLIQGESGTGKELFARSLHQHSRRSDKPFIAENCAALPETLLESELFGHTRGAFTGADRNRKGRFATAHKGTLFLDEVGDMSPGLQKKLLRALQEGEIRPVGSSTTEKVDVRFLSASNKDLLALVQRGLFREDLYYRLSPIKLELPPLRQRQGDIEILVTYLSKSAAEQCRRSEPPIFTEEAIQQLCRYRWPGNVRELQNEIQRSVALVDVGRPIGVEDLSPEIQAC
jgi:transcriptional regulator with GAF, ATPase, and Fis domain